MIKDLQSELQPVVALGAVISTNTNTDGAIIDTANFQLGIMFTLDINLFSDGAYELQILESDDSGMSGATQVVAPNILPTDLGANSISASALVAQGAILQKIGVFGTKRYLQARIVSTGVTSGATARVTACKAAELVPAATS